MAWSHTLGKGGNIVAIVRIYKESDADELQINPWQVRSDGCTEPDSSGCHYGRNHGGYCDGFFVYEYVLNHLNDPYTELGAYITK